VHDDQSQHKTYMKHASRVCFIFLYVMVNGYRQRSLDVDPCVTSIDRPSHFKDGHPCCKDPRAKVLLDPWQAHSHRIPLRIVTRLLQPQHRHTSTLRTWCPKARSTSRTRRRILRGQQEETATAMALLPAGRTWNGDTASAGVIAACKVFPG